MASANNRRPASWAAIGTLAVFVGAFFVVRWVVKTQRSPGAITVVEAQGMDMTAMRAPTGVQPVNTVVAKQGNVASRTQFPATIMAFSDEEIVARIPGRVLRIAYPGDRVKAGQVVVQLDANEYLAQARQAELTANASLSQLTAAEREIERQRTLKAQAIAEVDSADVRVSKAQSDLDATMAEARQGQADIKAKAATVRDRETDVTYANQVLERKQSLYKAGAISLNDYQSALATRNSSAAKLESATADQDAANQAANAAKSRVAAASGEVSQAKSQSKLARLGVSTADKSVALSVAQARAMKSQAQAASSQANSASIVAGYTELRALDSSMVAERLVSPGSVVAAGQKLLKLHVADTVRVQAQLPQSLNGTVQIGTPVEVAFGSICRSAKLTTIFPTSDPSTRTFTVEALIDNPRHDLLPGGFATMAVQSGSSQQAISLPREAILTDADGKHFVWVSKTLPSTNAPADWTCPMHTEVSKPGPGKCPICGMDLVQRSRHGDTVARRRVVTVGQDDGTSMAVLSGISEGDEVIVAGLDGLIEGTPIRITAKPAAAQQPAKITQKAEPAKPVAAHQLYVCPMHPDVVRDKPGKCPKCGMELVPRKAK